ncbi:MAG TPA: hypothetical protein VKR06_19025 [Ktedonosporobacter sp.]|nr:hypothetical protein [Ktedonosporobacter sp.]
MKQESGHNDEELMAARISPGDLMMIGHILRPYASFVRCIVPPSKERGLRLTTIEHLRRRITDSKAVGESEQFLLTEAELSVIDAALKNFAASLLRVVPKSEERDAAVKACEGLRGYLVTTLRPTEE